jgi:hypothetical protein
MADGMGVARLTDLPPEWSRRHQILGFPSHWPSIRRVERSLYERANGYNYEAVKIFMPAGSKQPVVVHYIEHLPPDPTSAMFWLKNRDPDNWRDVQNVDHVLSKYIISDRPMTEEQWAAERATIIDERSSRSCRLQRSDAEGES